MSIELKLVDPTSTVDLGVLYQLLIEREGDNTINISNKQTPTFENHVKFVKSNPYEVWYMIIDKEYNNKIGGIYLTKDHAFGYFILKQFHGKGFGQMAFAELRKLHPYHTYYSHINPANERAIHLTKKFGGKHIENVYEITFDDKLGGT